MNKSDLVAAIASEAGITKADSDKTLNALISVITASLKKGEKVTIPGFITLSKENRPERDGRNPSTGAKIKIAAKNVVKAKIGKTLSEEIK